MNWFGFAPGREGLVVDAEREPSAAVDRAAPGDGAHAASDARGAADAASAGTDTLAVERDADRGDAVAGGAPSVQALLTALGALGAVPMELAPRVEEVLREVAMRHPGSLELVDALSTGGAAGAAVVLVIERHVTPEVSVDDVAGRFGLTRRQASVALLLARRHSNTEIARLLAVSPHTARHHTERVLERLGVSSRMEVAALVLGGR